MMMMCSGYLRVFIHGASKLINLIKSLKFFEVNIVEKLESLICVFNLHHPVAAPRDDSFDYKMSNNQ